MPTPDPASYIVFNGNFESGNFSAWTNTTTAAVNLSVENQMLKCATSYATNECWGYLYKWLDQNYTSLYWRWYVFFDNLPTTDYSYIGAGGMYNSGIETNFGPENSVCSLNVVCENDAAYWRLSFSNNSQLYNYTSPRTVEEDTWYLVELKAIQGGGDGEVHFYLNNAEEYNATALTNNNNSGINNVSIGGGISAGQPVTWYCAGSVAGTEYIGPKQSTESTMVADFILSILAICTIPTTSLVLRKYLLRK